MILTTSSHENKKALGPMGVLHSLFIKNIFYDKWTSGFFIFVWRYSPLVFLMLVLQTLERWDTAYIQKKNFWKEKFANKSQKESRNFQIYIVYRWKAIEKI